MAGRESPLSIRTSAELKDQFGSLAKEAGKDHGEFLEHVLGAYQSVSATGSVDVPDELSQVKSAVNRILEIFTGVYSNGKLAEENVRASLGQEIARLNQDNSDLTTSNRSLIEKVRALEVRIKETDGVASAFDTMKNELDSKNKTIGELKNQLGEQATQLKNLPKITSLEKDIVRLETENLQLKERMEDFRRLTSVERVGSSSTELPVQ